MGGHFLLQGIFPAQGLNQSLLNWQAASLLLTLNTVRCTLPLSHQGNPSLAATNSNVNPISYCLRMSYKAHGKSLSRGRWGGNIAHLSCLADGREWGLLIFKCMILIVEYLCFKEYT